MKKLFHILGVYYRTCFNWWSLCLSMLLAAILTFFAYRHHFYESYIEDHPVVSVQIWRYCGLYGIAFIGGFVLQGFAEKNFRFLKSPYWWVLSALSIGLFAFRGSDFDFMRYMFGGVPNEFWRFYNKVSYNLAGVFALLIPCFIYWFLIDRKQENFYGFRIKGVNLWPYIILLAMMLPPLYWAGTQPDFLETYPRYTKIGISPSESHYVRYVLLYELVYGSDFVFTEFFFRGFIILAFARHFGHRAILPMCVYYVTIHFGKPLGETISSFFGGLLLGVIAFRTRSIYGGIIVHLGIAYLMEFFAFLGRHGHL